MFKLPRKWLPRILLCILALGVALGVYFGIEFRGKSKSPFRDAPRFSLRDDQGLSHSLESLARDGEGKGTLLFVHFWATWCPPCLEELPSFVEFARKHEAAGAQNPVRFVAISLDRSWNEAHRFLKPEKLPKNLISLLDPESQVPEAFGSFQFPETYLLGPDLKILAKWVGPQEWSSGSWEELLSPLFQAVLKRNH